LDSGLAVFFLQIYFQEKLIGSYFAYTTIIGSVVVLAKKNIANFHCEDSSSLVK